MKRSKWEQLRRPLPEISPCGNERNEWYQNRTNLT